MFEWECSFSQQDRTRAGHGSVYNSVNYAGPCTIPWPLCQRTLIILQTIKEEMERYILYNNTLFLCNKNAKSMKQQNISIKIREIKIYQKMISSLRWELKRKLIMFSYWFETKFVTNLLWIYCLPFPTADSQQLTSDTH